MESVKLDIPQLDNLNKSIEETNAKVQKLLRAIEQKEATSPSPNPELISHSRAKKKYNRSDSWFSRMRKAGKLRCVKFGNTPYYYISDFEGMFKEVR